MAYYSRYRRFWNRGTSGRRDERSVESARAPPEEGSCAESIEPEECH